MKVEISYQQEQGTPNEIYETKKNLNNEQAQ